MATLFQCSVLSLTVPFCSRLRCSEIRPWHDGHCNLARCSMSRHPSLADLSGLDQSQTRKGDCTDGLDRGRSGTQRSDPRCTRCDRQAESLLRVSSDFTYRSAISWLMALQILSLSSVILLVQSQQSISCPSFEFFCPIVALLYGNVSYDSCTPNFNGDQG